MSKVGMTSQATNTSNRTLGGKKFAMPHFVKESGSVTSRHVARYWRLNDMLQAPRHHCPTTITTALHASTLITNLYDQWFNARSDHRRANDVVSDTPELSETSVLLSGGGEQTISEMHAPAAGFLKHATFPRLSARPTRKTMRRTRYAGPPTHCISNHTNTTQYQTLSENTNSISLTRSNIQWPVDNLATTSQPIQLTANTDNNEHTMTNQTLYKLNNTSSTSPSNLSNQSNETRMTGNSSDVVLSDLENRTSNDLVISDHIISNSRDLALSNPQHCSSRDLALTDQLNSSNGDLITPCPQNRNSSNSTLPDSQDLILVDQQRSSNSRLNVHSSSASDCSDIFACGQHSLMADVLSLASTNSSLRCSHEDWYFYDNRMVPPNIARRNAMEAMHRNGQYKNEMVISTVLGLPSYNDLTANNAITSRTHQGVMETPNCKDFTQTNEDSNSAQTDLELSSNNAFTHTNGDTIQTNRDVNETHNVLEPPDYYDFTHVNTVFLDRLPSYAPISTNLRSNATVTPIINGPPPPYSLVASPQLANACITERQPAVSQSIFQRDRTNEELCGINRSSSRSPLPLAVTLDNPLAQLNRNKSINIADNQQISDFNLRHTSIHQLTDQLRHTNNEQLTDQLQLQTSSNALCLQVVPSSPLEQRTTGFQLRGVQNKMGYQSCDEQCNMEYWSHDRQCNNDNNAASARNDNQNSFPSHGNFVQRIAVERCRELPDDYINHTSAPDTDVTSNDNVHLLLSHIGNDMRSQLTSTSSLQVSHMSSLISHSSSQIPQIPLQIPYMPPSQISPVEPPPPYQRHRLSEEQLQLHSRPPVRWNRITSPRRWSSLQQAILVTST